MSLPSTVSSTTNTTDLNVVAHVESIKNVDVNHHHHSKSHPSWKNSIRSDISLCPRAPWSMSLCSLLPTVPSTTNPRVLYVARHVNSINNSHFNHHYQSILRPLKKILTNMIHPNVSDLPGLLLQVFLAVHGLVDHQLICSKCVQTCWNYEKLSCQPPSPQHITSL